MQRQQQMEDSFLIAHREFMANLEKSLSILEDDIAEAAEMEHICTDEWCRATELVIDELAKVVYSISEPRWLTPEDSKKLMQLRSKMHELYADFSGARA